MILLLAVGITYWFYANKPQTKKKKPSRPVPVVSTIALQPGDEAIVFEASGTVIPAKKVELFSEVEGRITQQNPNLVPGGIIAADDLVVQIDPEDYRLQVHDREAEVATARYELEVEEGKQIIARQEWRILEREMQGDQVSKDLALRKPHLQNAKARLAAAQSRLATARLAESRTSIRAPFTGVVLEENVEIGQFIGKQSNIATLVATDSFWVQTSVPLYLLRRIVFPGKNQQKGSRAQIVLENGHGGDTVIHDGSVFKLLGDLDPKGRMARVLVTVQDPLNLKPAGDEAKGESGSAGKILLGSFVKVRIEAGSLNGVYALPRQGLREGDRVWTVNSDGIVSFRQVRILWRRIQEVLVTMDLPQGERIIVSRLQSPVAGMLVRDESTLQAPPAKKQP